MNEVGINESLERRQAELAQAQLSAIVESSADAIYTYDFNGTILTWNKSAEELYGYTGPGDHRAQRRHTDFARPQGGSYRTPDPHRQSRRIDPQL